jgi:hypothetical protein
MEKKKISIWQWIALVIIVNIIVAVATYGGSSSYYKQQLKENAELHSEMLISKHNVISSMIGDLEAVKSELATLKQSLSKMEPDGRLSQDISDYIHTNFPIIPGVLYNEIAVQIATLSRQENVSPELVVGIIQVESAFNPMAISSKNARGLMQVMPAWAKHFKLNKVCDLHNINVGIHTGIKVFKIHVQEEKGDISEGLYKYVNRDRSYVDRVYNAMGKFVMFRSRVVENKSTIVEEHSTPAKDLS